MKCVNCSHEQATGKFCGKCGTPLQVAEIPIVEEGTVSKTEHEAAATVESATIANPSPNPETTHSSEQVARGKGAFEKYIDYIKEFAVNPSRIFQNPEVQFTNALITLAIVLLMASYAIFLAIKEFFISIIGSIAGGIAGGFFGEGIGGGVGDFLGSQVPKLSLFPTFGNAFMTLALLVGLSVLISWLVMQISKQPLNFKQLIGIYGTLLIPVIGVLALSFLLILIKNLALGVGLLILALLIAAYLYPIRIVLRNYGGELKIDSIHRGLMYFGGFSIITYIIFTQYINAKLAPFKAIFGDIMEEILYYF